MLPAAERLKKDSDFNAVMSAGQKQRIGALLFLATSGGSEKTRFGLVVSKKVDKRATARNKIRRQLGELLRQLEPVTPPLDVVIIVLRSADFADYQQALNQWRSKR